MSEHFDLVVIGGGSAGGEAGRRAVREHGARVAVIERKRWGGECGSVACKPTKQYAAAADLLNDIRVVGRDLGIATGEISFDLAALNARKDWLIGGPDRWRERFGTEGMTQIDGEATIVDAGTVKVGDRVLTTERVLVATGSRVAVPPVAGLDEIQWLDNEAALNLTETPGALLVIGAGAVGLEFGQMFARFGSQVTIVSSSSTIAGRADHEASRGARRCVARRGNCRAHRLDGAFGRTRRGRPHRRRARRRRRDPHRRRRPGTRRVGSSAERGGVRARGARGRGQAHRGS